MPNEVLELEVQKYLRGGKTLIDLNNEFGIEVTPHPSLPLTILNYCQINSKPRAAKIVRECRGLVLELDTWNVVAPCILRFFNYQEGDESFPQFNWNGPFTVQEKLDGSIITLFNYKNKWYCKTRASWGQSPITKDSPTWEETVLEALGLQNLQELNDHFLSNMVLVGELCSIHNKIVQYHPTPKFYLITVFHNNKEVTHESIKAFHKYTKEIGYGLKIEEIKTYNFKDIHEATQELVRISSGTPTFEGFVFRDSTNERLKKKSDSYVALHHLRGENGNMEKLKYLVPLCLRGVASEIDEIIVYFPEFGDNLRKTDELLKKEFSRLQSAWDGAVHNGTQKDFALSIQGKTKFSNMLFISRKTGESLTSLWQRSAESIASVLEK